MGSVPPLLTFLLMVVSGWVHRRQLIVIEFLQAENRLLKERLRGKRIRFTDAERALLARKAKAVGRKALLELDTLLSHKVGRGTIANVLRRNGNEPAPERSKRTTWPDEAWMLQTTQSFNAANGSAECLTSTISKRRERCRPKLWTLRARRTAGCGEPRPGHRSQGGRRSSDALKQAMQDVSIPDQ
jgi:hypothetical protein